MKFYEELSKHYQDIFPLSEEQIVFLKETFGDVPKEVLDIACGTGIQAIALAESGYGVTAVDQTPGMIQIATEDAETRGVSLATLTCSMLALSEHITGQFDGVFCIGNSLVHLGNYGEVQQFMAYLPKLLKANGKVVLQIINYHRILKKGISQLPEIKNPQAGLAFFRNYEAIEDKLLFHTKLDVQGNVLENTVPLLPISWEKMVEMAQGNGMQVIAQYGSFAKAPFEPDESMHWIGVLQ
ncbi:MAG: class I SAM-dependent methyltransferase [Cellulosilyticaceae bacterium]